MFSYFLSLNFGKLNCWIQGFHIQPLIHFPLGLVERMCQFSVLPAVWERNSSPRPYQQFVIFSILSQKLDIKINMRRRWFQALRWKFPKMITFSALFNKRNETKAILLCLGCECDNSEIHTQDAANRMIRCLVPVTLGMTLQHSGKDYSLWGGANLMFSSSSNFY